MRYVFISYSHKDKTYVHRLQEKLQKEGFEVWIDDRIDFGTEWPKVIQQYLDKCDAFIVVATENAYKSKWVQNEVSRAARKKKPIFPILLSGDRWLSFENEPFADVTDGTMPTDDFFQHLSQFVPRIKQPNASVKTRKISELSPHKYSKDSSSFDSSDKVSPTYAPSSSSKKANGNIVTMVIIVLITLMCVGGVVFQSVNSQAILNQVEVVFAQKVMCLDVLIGEDKGLAMAKGMDEYDDCAIYNVSNKSNSAVEIMIHGGDTLIGEFGTPCNNTGKGTFQSLPANSSATYLCTDEYFDWVEPRRCVEVQITGFQLLGPKKQFNCGPWLE